MPFGIDLLLLLIALLCAVASLAGKVHAAVPTLIVCLELLLQLAGR